MPQDKISTKDVLKIIGVSGVIVASMVFPNLPIGVAAAIKAWKNINKRDLGRIIKRLEKQDMISISEADGKTKIEITDKGKRRLLEYDFENIELQAKKRDGKWRLVMFDIPNSKKSARDSFRKKLLQLGLIKLQKSIFVCAFPCKKEIDFLCHFLDISDYVSLVVLDRIERGQQLVFKQYFVDDTW